LTATTGRLFVCSRTYYSSIKATGLTYQWPIIGMPIRLAVVGGVEKGVGEGEGFGCAALLDLTVFDALTTDGLPDFQANWVQCDT